MDYIKKLELEIAAKKACIEDLQVAMAFHKQHGTYNLAAECAWRIKKAEHAIKRLEVQLLDNKNFGGLIQDLAQQGIFSRTVKKLANENI
ncbi:hypothetical protein [Lysinibacillus sp. OF-1]|uniref:hypothetical protein n=1 Tax=Lysinibacillus sp. OF-1 TaxID=2972483 RepID=UPI00232B3B8E|nr:hypothetical protein [Lysinibacillus sp. OF-1]WCH45834.1 hypothetical protein NV349_12025 [Lysinibacillus sp. OF-1]